MLADNVSNISRLDKIISSDNKVFRRTGGRKLFFPIKQISFSNVDFKFAKNDTFRLKNINFNINLGKVTALVGPSGSGKTSLLDLLIGLYEPNKGEILLNGEININKLNLDYWQQSISIVHQDIFLFNTSIINNLKFGHPNTTFNQIKKACQASGADEFIEKLPEGYETIIGERGLKLSGGQRQRISIARALVKPNPILVLDEATSALDSISEDIFQSFINKIKDEKLILVVAHRLSTIKNCDEIIVLNEGKIVGSGNHNELLKTNQIYNQLWAIQTKK
nr:ATP-binding cassette domain-containing protein [Prochlorococcus marinus]